jgi:hypothetical protein
MARLLIALMILILGVSGDGKIVNKRDIMITNDWNQFVSWLCQNDLASIWGIICGSSTTSAPISTTTMASSTSKSAASSTSTASNNNMGTSSPTTLERAHWCQFSNGTYIPYGYTFMYSACTLCQCGQSHAISCTTLQCMPTYCIDGSTPSPKPGQCCPQCAYENTSTPCVVNGVSFPQGTLLRQTSDNVQCWCQLGGIECRKATVSLFSSLDLFGDGTAVYVIVIIVCAVILLGTLLCCGCTIFFYYYYYQRQQQAAQDLTEYYMNAGWQPMSEDGQVIEDTSEQKQAEAEQAQYEFENPASNSEEYIPPPYALYNGSFVNEQNEKDQKHM